MIRPDQIAFIGHGIQANPVPGKAHIPDGCFFYRCFLPMGVIGGSHAGYPAWTGSLGFGIKDGDKTARFGYKTVVLKLLMERNLPHQIKAAQKIGQRVVVDVDDWYEDIPEGNLARTATSAASDKFRNREAYVESILFADTITVSTPFLLEKYSEMHPDVRMVRNGVYLPMFTRNKVRNRKPVIGWVGACAWKGDDLPQLNDWLPDFLEDHDLMFHHSGEMATPLFTDIVKINPLRFTSLPLAPIDQFDSLFPPIDIGIIPLDATHDFNAAKSFLRGIEMAAAGVPFIASPTEEYVTLAADGIGRIANTPEQWVTEVERLMDYKQRKIDAATNYDKTATRWTIEARAGQWASALLGDE